jgi:hypothetical protein
MQGENKEEIKIIAAQPIASLFIHPPLSLSLSFSCPTHVASQRTATTSLAFTSYGLRTSEREE